MISRLFIYLLYTLYTRGQYSILHKEQANGLRYLRAGKAQAFYNNFVSKPGLKNGAVAIWLEVFVGHTFSHNQATNSLAQ